METQTYFFILANLASRAIITRMIRRRITQTLLERLDQFPAVALIGPRQVGKTTLADLIANVRPSIYLDLELSSDREKLKDPELYLQKYENTLVIIDEIQRVPELFQTLRGLIDQGKKRGFKAGRFLLLGSASLDLLKQSGESLAGRIAYIELSPFDVLEIKAEELDKLWIRGGFPDSFLASTDKNSFIWRENFIKTYLERDIPQLGSRIPAETLLRFWTMLAHTQGGLLNAASLARGLAVDGKAVARYLDLMVDLLLVRRLLPYQINIGKRLTKSPKIYVRDSGIVHALLGVMDYDKLAGNPIIGASWEGFVIENFLNVIPSNVQYSFYRTAAGAEMDLLLEIPGKGLWAIEIKRSLAPKLDKGFYYAIQDLKPARTFIIYAGKEHYTTKQGIEMISIEDMANILSEL